MPKWKPLLAALAVLALVPLAAAQHAAPEDRNAALKYWAAWTMIPRETSQAIADMDWEQPGTPDGLAEKMKDAEPAIQLLIEGSRLRRCDFEIDYEKGIEALLPHLGKAREGARVLRADARLKLAAGDVNAAADRLAAIYRTAAHVARDDVMISGLVAIALAKFADAEVNALLASGALTAAARDTILDGMSRLAGSDPFHTRAAVAGEKALITPWVKQFQGPRAGDDLATRINSGLAADQPQIAALRRLGAAEVKRQVDGLTRYYDEATSAWDDPDAVNKLNTLHAGDVAREYGALAAALAPVLGRAREADLKAQAELAQTLAAVKAAEVK